jgi:hypothetical protein
MNRFILAAAFGLIATLAQAGINEGQVASLFQAKGYTNIEITTGPTQIKVEATKAGVQVQVVYDIATGNILAQHNVVAKAIAAHADVLVSHGARDFSGSDGSTDGTSGSGTEVGDDNGGSGTEVGDDNGGSGTESGDDNGGSTTSGGTSGRGGKHSHSGSDN